MTTEPLNTTSRVVIATATAPAPTVPPFAYYGGKTALADRIVEVTRTATDGTRNVNSLLYGAAWRAARALGCCRLLTYTQAGEPGTSLRAGGWRAIAERPAHNGWDHPSRPRNASYLSTARTLWEAPT